MKMHRIQRRQFCFTYPAAIAAGLLGRVAAETPWRPRYILASSLYGTMALADIVPQVRRTGAEHIDLWPAPHANQREQVETMGRDAFAALLTEHNVGLGIVSRYDLGPFALADEMRVVKALGGRVIVCGSRGPANLTGDALAAAVERFAEQMKPHLETAAENGVTIAIENHGSSLICSPESMYRLADAIESPCLGIALAPYHLPQDPQLIATVIRRLGPRLAHVYAWQYGKGCHTAMPKDDELLQMPGRGPMDFAPMLAALRDIRYAGWLEIFMHPIQRGTPVLPTLSEITIEVNRARAYLTSSMPKGSSL